MPLRVPITTIRDPGKGIRNVRVEARALGKVDLVPVPVRVGAAGMARLGAARDDEAAPAGALEGDGAGDAVGVDLLVRGAGGHVAVGAAARGARADAGGLEAGLRGGLAELLALDGGEGRDGGGDDGGELE